MFFTGEVEATADQPGPFVHVHGRNLTSSPEVDGLLLTLIDGTQAQRREQDLERHALYDSLTELPNRTLLLERLHQTSERDPLAASLMIIDLDGFKLVNDSFGHVTGDMLLVEVAHRLRHASPPGATIARLGGDEFAVLLPTTPAEAAANLAEAYCQDLREPVPGAPYPPITASIGVSDVTGADDALRRADLAMYAAKVAGRNQAVLYSPHVEQSIPPPQSPRRSPRCWPNGTGCTPSPAPTRSPAWATGELSTST